MPITVTWYNDEKTILLETFEGKWTLAEYRQLIDDAADLLALVDHTVHIIVDGTNSGALPGQIVAGMRYAIQKIPPNQGITVFVNVDLFTRVLVNVAGEISPRIAQTAFTVPSLENAIQLIEQETAKHA